MTINSTIIKLERKGNAGSNQWYDMIYTYIRSLSSYLGGSSSWGQCLQRSLVPPTSGTFQEFNQGERPLGCDLIS